MNGEQGAKAGEQGQDSMVGLPLLAQTSSQKKSPKSSTPLTVNKQNEDMFLRLSKDKDLLGTATSEINDALENDFTISGPDNKELQVNIQNQK